MSTRHLFNSSDGLVTKSLRGVVAYNPRLSLDETNRVIYDTAHDRSKVSIISGGGAGHEPAWSGYVGANMLAASISGGVFASPTTKQVLAAAERVPSDAGTLMVIGNYTGDCLHFGLANEKLIANGAKSRLLICGDDVSIKKGGRVGRRGLPGQFLAIKMIGGAAERGGSLDDVYELGVATSEQTVTIAATLDRCHVPGRRQDEHATVSADSVELGTGVHNEPGYMKITPAPEADELVRQMLMHCLDETDKDRGYMHLEPADKTVLLINNLGGMSYLEMGALVDEVLQQLEADWDVIPARVYSGPAETSLNAAGFSISLTNLTAAAKSCAYTANAMKDLLDMRTDTHWESLAGSQAGQRRLRREQLTQAEPAPQPRPAPEVELRVEPGKLESVLWNACEKLIDAEPDLTRWDTVMGDGDCGETVKTGAMALLAALDGEKVAESGSTDTILATLEDVAESKMGGTLGGILGILFTSLRAAIGKDASDAPPTLIWAAAVSSALASLRQYTPAAVGDRTILDTLIPFSEALHTGNFDTAVDAAVNGAESTRKIAPRLGRATYVGVTAGEVLPPDPGAWAAAVAIKGLRDGMS